MSSVGSNSSKVSFRGEDMVDIDECLDQLFKELQHNLNHAHCVVRQLAACPEQDCDFIQAVKIQFELDDHVIVLLDLFTELRQISKETLGKAPNEHKETYTKMVSDRKEQQKK